MIVGADGKPLRDHRGAVVTDWSDRRAVILGAKGKPACADNPPAYERNPAADRVPMLGRDDLIRLAFDAAPRPNPYDTSMEATQRVTCISRHGGRR